ncbi:MAG: 4-alpha-glucanotransferase [Verrucomicrobia bacterium]|nr:4-alpha-glucanotransferase [Verrucomicrobiota bacterium]
MKTEKHWERIGLKPHHGIALPLSALRTKKSCGIGEFSDLIPLIDWCKNLGFDCLQLLPLMDTGDDASPYNPISSCALDPIYLSLADLPGAHFLNLDELKTFTKLPRVAIRELKHVKLEWLYRYFKQAFEAVSQEKSYLLFVESHPWLLPYALFKAYKDEYGGKNWRDWPLEMQSYDEALIESKRESIDFHSFLQYFCYQQLGRVKEYAASRHVFLKGDVPILLSPDSADVWADKNLFILDLAAGAPPDYYNKEGQKWGFPLFNWDAMRRTGFAWWRRRLDAASHLFHIYRIDHVVGFFRIWAIPEASKPAEGHFVPENRDLWAGQGKELLEMMIDASPLLPMAEDLGTIPPEVYPILKELGICGTKVIRWTRYDDQKTYIPYSDYEPFSMTTVSTHDADTLSGWWKRYPDEAHAFSHFKGWTYQPELSREKIFEILRDSHHTPSYFHINLLQEYLALFPELVWANPDEERINVPGALLPNNWTYRFKPYVEEIVSHQGLAEKMRRLLTR